LRAVVHCLVRDPRPNRVAHGLSEERPAERHLRAAEHPAALRRITICAWHHLRGIHAGGVRTTGEAPADITWELGVRAGRRPLLRLHGDRYLE